MGVFEFIILLTIISTAGKVLSRPRPSRERREGLSEGERGDLERIRATVDDLSGRLGRLEEERDFYKDLLDSPKRRLEISPPDEAEGNPTPPG